MRTTSSTRSAAPCISGRQDGVVTLTPSPLPSDVAAERFQYRSDLALGSVEPASFATRPVSKAMRAPLRHRARDRRLRRLAAADLEDHLRRQIEAGQHGCGIDAALEAVARVRHEAGLAPGRGRAQPDRSRRSRSTR